jgi:hypothetical protein
MKIRLRYMNQATRKKTRTKLILQANEAMYGSLNTGVKNLA